MEYKLEQERLVKVVELTQAVYAKHLQIASDIYSVGKLNYSSGIMAMSEAVLLALDDGNFKVLEKHSQQIS